MIIEYVGYAFLMYFRVVSNKKYYILTGLLNYNKSIKRLIKNIYLVMAQIFQYFKIHLYFENFKLFLIVINCTRF